jgi:hypothetical protein
MKFNVLFQSLLSLINVNVAEAISDTKVFFGGTDAFGGNLLVTNMAHS